MRAALLLTGLTACAGVEADGLEPWEIGGVPFETEGEFVEEPGGADWSAHGLVKPEDFQEGAGRLAVIGEDGLLVCLIEFELAFVDIPTDCAGCYPVYTLERVDARSELTEACQDWGQDPAALEGTTFGAGLRDGELWLDLGEGWTGTDGWSNYQGGLWDFSWPAEAD